MHPLRFALALLTLALVQAACGNAPPVDEAEQRASSTAPSAHVVDLAALDYAFGMPTEIPAGWVTFRMGNMGAEEHIGLLQAVHDSLDLETVQELIRNGGSGDWGPCGPPGWRGQECCPPAGPGKLRHTLSPVYTSCGAPSRLPKGNPTLIRGWCWRFG